MSSTTVNRRFTKASLPKPLDRTTTTSAAARRLVHRPSLAGEEFHLRKSPDQFGVRLRRLHGMQPHHRGKLRLARNRRAKGFCQLVMDMLQYAGPEHHQRLLGIEAKLRAGFAGGQRQVARQPGAAAEDRPARIQSDLDEFVPVDLAPTKHLVGQQGIKRAAFFAQRAVNQRVRGDAQRPCGECQRRAKTVPIMFRQNRGRLRDGQGSQRILRSAASRRRSRRPGDGRRAWESVAAPRRRTPSAACAARTADSRAAMRPQRRDEGRREAESRERPAAAATPARVRRARPCSGLGPGDE